MRYRSALTGSNFEPNGELKKINWRQVRMPVHWFRNDPLLSYFGNFYIAITAEIERFSIQSMNTLCKNLSDTRLATELQQFIHEEKAHAYMHTQVTRHLARFNYPTKFIEKYSKRFFNLCKKRLSQKSQIALVLNMEFVAHELSLLALKYNFFASDTPPIYDFLRWHAVEELSHATLCFQSYKNVGGGYIRRSFMLLLFFIFVFLMLVFYIPLSYISDLQKGFGLQIGKLWHTLRLIFGFRGFFWGSAKASLRLFTPNVHPDVLSSHPVPKKKYLNTKTAGFLQTLNDKQYQHLHAANPWRRIMCTEAQIKDKQTIVDVSIGSDANRLFINTHYRAMQLISISMDVHRSKPLCPPRPSARNNRLHTIKGSDTSGFPLQWKSIDRVLAMESLLYLSSREHFFKEACQVLKPDGLICISDFVPHALFFFPAWIISTRGFRRINPLGNGDISYTLASYQRIADKFGLQMTVCDQYPYQATSQTSLGQLFTATNNRGRIKKGLRIRSLACKFLLWSGLLRYTVMYFKNKTS